MTKICLILSMKSVRRGKNRKKWITPPGNSPGGWVPKRIEWSIMPDLKSMAGCIRSPVLK